MAQSYGQSGLMQQAAHYAQAQYYSPSNSGANADQRLSAYVNNRRVSNPPAMFPAAQAFAANANGMPSSLPANTGFFYYHNLQQQQPTQPAGKMPLQGSPGQSRSTASMRRNSTLSSTTSFSAMHRIDEDARVNDSMDLDDEDYASNGDEEEDDDDDVVEEGFNVNQMETDATIGDSSKRQRKRT